MVSGDIIAFDIGPSVIWRQCQQYSEGGVPKVGSRSGLEKITCNFNAADSSRSARTFNRLARASLANSLFLVRLATCSREQVSNISCPSLTLQRREAIRSACRVE